MVLLAADGLAVAPPFHLQAAMDGAAVAVVGSTLLQQGCQPIPAVSTLPTLLLVVGQVNPAGASMLPEKEPSAAYSSGPRHPSQLRHASVSSLQSTTAAQTDVVPK